MIFSASKKRSWTILVIVFGSKLLKIISMTTYSMTSCNLTPRHSFARGGVIYSPLALIANEESGFPRSGRTIIRKSPSEKVQWSQNGRRVLIWFCGERSVFRMWIFSTDRDTETAVEITPDRQFVVGYHSGKAVKPPHVFSFCSLENSCQQRKFYKKNQKRLVFFWLCGIVGLWLCENGSYPAYPGKIRPFVFPQK